MGKKKSVEERANIFHLRDGVFEVTAAKLPLQAFRHFRACGVQSILHRFAERRCMNGGLAAVTVRRPALDQCQLLQTVERTRGGGTRDGETGCEFALEQ